MTSTWLDMRNQRSRLGLKDADREQNRGPAMNFSEVYNDIREENARLRSVNSALKEASEGLLEAFSLGPLGCAAKYGPDVDVREVEGAAVDALRAALKLAKETKP